MRPIMPGSAWSLPALGISSIKMTYRESLAYLDSLINYEKKSGYDYQKSIKLERMRSLSARLDDPHKGIRAVHIAGTKGKGSVSVLINSILMQAGYRVGLYTSPHLFSFRERIRVDGRLIDEEAVAGSINDIIPHVEQMGKEGDEPTYFEICTMIAFLYFKLKDVQLMVLEVGMGGRLDSTNIADSLISVITPISYDHTQYLGSTLAKIASEKCGIIKDDSILISAPQEKEAMDVIERISGEKRTSLYTVGRDIIFEGIGSNPERQIFRLLTRYSEYPQLEIRLLGDFQLDNAAAAVAAAEELRSRGIIITKDAIKDGLAKAKWPGRLEIIHKKPLVVVDGAQDVNSISRLRRSVKDIFKYNKLFLVVGAMADKDIDGICRELYNMPHYIAATRSNSERACPPEMIRDIMLKYNSDVNIVTTDSVNEAMKRCIELAGEDDLILATGSLYVVAEVMRYCRKESGVSQSGTSLKGRHIVDATRS